MNIDFRRSQARDAGILEADEKGCTVLLGAGGGGISLPQVNEGEERYLTGDDVPVFPVGGRKGKAVYAFRHPAPV